MRPNFLSELKRRNVFKVALTYTVIAWLLIQLALIPELEVPGWAIKTLVVLLAIGFIVIAFVSWAFEATPEGMKRTADISRSLRFASSLEIDISCCQSSLKLSLVVTQLVTIT